MKSHWKFSQSTHSMHPIGTITHVLVRFVLFHYCTKVGQNGTNWCNSCTSSCSEVVLEFFATNGPDPPHWTLNGLWRFGPFCHSTKVGENGPNWCNSCTSSCNQVTSEFFATNAPDPPHWTLNSCFATVWTVLLLHESRCKTRQTGAINAQVRTAKSHWNFSQRKHPMPNIGPITQVLLRFALFHYCMKVGAKRGRTVQLMHKFVHRSRVRIFCNECTRSAPLDPKLIFWGVSDHSFNGWMSVQKRPNWSN
jgi:hypothetical protein